MNKAELAEKNFNEGCNCCQAVVLAYAEEMGLTEKEALRIGSLFGGGFGRLREVCGAVSGMTMVAGYMKGYDDLTDAQAKKDAYALERTLIDLFTKKYKSAICRDILALAEKEKAGDPSERTAQYYAERPCGGCVRTAAEILEKEIFGRSPEKAEEE